MKKEKQNTNNNLLQRAATQSKYSKKTKSPASNSQPKSSNNHSYSVNFTSNKKFCFIAQPIYIERDVT